MISVLIVDDEYLIRNLLVNSVNWDALDMEVVGQAGDGETALSLIESLHPQIVLLDINIPFANGLEVAKAVQERNLGCRIIFLTGYREFSYAQDAIACQAFGYLLKPLAPGELTASLRALGDQINAEKAQQSHIELMERQSSKGLQMLKERFLHRLAFGTVPLVPMQLEKNFQELDIHLHPNNLLVLCLEFELHDDQWEEELYVYAVLNMLCERLTEAPEFSQVEPLSDVDSSCIILCNVTVPQEQVYEALTQIWDRLCPTIEIHLPALPTIALSHVFHGFSQVRDGVNQAMQAMDGRFYSQQTRLFFPMPAKVVEPAHSAAMINYEQLQLYMDMGDHGAGRDMIVALFTNMRTQQVQSVFAKMVALGLVEMMEPLSQKRTQSTDYNPTYLTNIKQATAFDAIEENLLAYYDQFTSESIQNKPYSKIVITAQEYIRDNFDQSGLSLKKVAAFVYATPAYVSSLFKKETNVSVTEYITICRMKRAAELLRKEEGISFTAVSEQVGYVDPYYFSRCFKKHYGLTPSKYLALQTQGNLNEQT